MNTPIDKEKLLRELMVQHDKLVSHALDNYYKNINCFEQPKGVPDSIREYTDVYLTRVKEILEVV